MTIGGWFLFGIIAICILIIALFIAWYWFDESGGPVPWITSIGIAVVLCIGLFVGMNAYYNNTESGKRALKSQESNFNSGIERTVTIYDVNGKVIGYNCGSVDGIFGDKTEATVKDCQEAHGLQADGEVDRNTWRVLLGM